MYLILTIGDQQFYLTMTFKKVFISQTLTCQIYYTYALITVPLPDSNNNLVQLKTTDKAFVWKNKYFGLHTRYTRTNLKQRKTNNYITFQHGGNFIPKQDKNIDNINNESTEICRNWENLNDAWIFIDANIINLHSKKLSQDLSQKKDVYLSSVKPY